MNKATPKKKHVYDNSNGKYLINENLLQNKTTSFNNENIKVHT